MKIVIIDDEQSIQRLFEQRFRKERKSGQVEFEFALSADDALKYLENASIEEVSLVLSDINMPGMSGLDLLKIIREKYPNLQVYMITAYGDEEKKRKAEEYGATAYFTKPLNFNNLKEKISLNADN